MPKGRAPSMLSQSNGALVVISAQRACQCKRCHATIPGSTSCVELPVASMGMTTKKRYCLACANAIVETTQEDLDKVRKSLPPLNSPAKEI